MNSGTLGAKRLFELSTAAAATFSVMLSGCGTSLTSSPSSPSGTTQAQSQPAAGPTLGYVWDAGSQSLRPVQGVPGASTLGRAVVSGGGPSGSFVAAAASGISGMALLLDGNGGVFQTPLAGGALTKVASVPGATTLALSNSGSYALVTGKNGSGASLASVISGLPLSPVVRGLGLAGVSAISGGAVSDTGTVALASVSAQGGVSILAFVGQGAGAQVATAQAFGGLQFVPNSDELVVGDGGSGVVTAISHVNTTPAAAVVSTAGGIAAPVALDVTPNGRWVVAANAKGDALRVDLTGGVAATKVHCSCVPTQVLALNGSAGGSTVRLVTAGIGPLWIVDAGASAPRVQFIPAAAGAIVPTVVTKSAM